MARVQHSDDLDMKILSLIAKAIPLTPSKGSLVLYPGARDGNDSYMLDKNGLQKYYRDTRNGTPITRYERVGNDEFVRFVRNLPIDARQQIIHTLVMYLRMDKPKSPSSYVGL